jgi:hypothetical protein
MKKILLALFAAAVAFAPMSTAYAGNGNDNHKHWKKQGHNNNHNGNKKNYHGNNKHGNYHGKKKYHGGNNNYYHGGNKYYYGGNNYNNFYEDPYFWGGVVGGLVGGAIINNQRNDYYEPQCYIQQVQVWDTYYQTWVIQNRQVCN